MKGIIFTLVLGFSTAAVAQDVTCNARDALRAQVEDIRTNKIGVANNYKIIRETNVQLPVIGRVFSGTSALVNTPILNALSYYRIKKIKALIRILDGTANLNDINSIRKAINAVEDDFAPDFKLSKLIAQKNLVDVAISLDEQGEFCYNEEAHDYEEILFIIRNHYAMIEN